MAGIRGAKSLTIAAAAVLATQIVDLSPVGIGDIVRVSILSLSKATARAVYTHVHNHIMASAPLSHCWWTSRRPTPLRCATRAGSPSRSRSLLEPKQEVTGRRLVGRCDL